MPDRIVKEDLRVKKIEKALNGAMSTLLNHQNFSKITVNGICNEALISRATFYAHYADKYDLLKDWLMKFHPYSINKNEAYEQIEEAANKFVRENEKIINNVLDGANSETLDIICGYILSILDIANAESTEGDLRLNYIVLSNFYSGGIIYYLMWQIKNKFPPDIPAMNIHLYNVIEMLRELESA